MTTRRFVRAFWILMFLLFGSLVARQELRGARPYFVVTVDRIAGGWAVLETPHLDFFDVPILDLPPGTTEGDRLTLTFTRYP